MRCILCKLISDSSLSLCSSCEQLLPWRNRTDFCVGCGLLTYKCICKEVGFHFDQIFVSFSYEQLMAKLIVNFKNKHKFVIGSVLTEFLIDYILDCYGANDLPEVIIPVPLSAKKLSERGFNHIVFMARIMAKKLAIALDFAAIKKMQHTAAQINLVKARRKLNLRNAFRFKKRLSCQHIVILDDVVTTGTTVNTIAKLCRENRVKQIDVWALCRA